MKKQNIKTAVTLTTLAGILLVNAAPAVAKEYEGTSKVGVDVTADTLIIPEPTDPTLPPTTSPDGNFGLLYTPKEYIFSDLVVPSKTATEDEVVELKDPETTTNPKIKNVAVGDVRGTRKSGWKLTAQLAEELTSTANGPRTLTGATIESTQVLKELTDPRNNVLGDVVSLELAPIAESSVTFSTSSALVMSAAAETSLGAADGKGEGYWNGQFSEIKLIIPAATMNKIRAGDEYTGTVDWTLEDAFN